MIDIPGGRVTEACTGCAACAALCPADAIDMGADEEGFPVPFVNLEACTDCQACNRACPVNAGIGGTVAPLREAAAVFAAWTRDAERRGAASSGGVFLELAEAIIGRGGIVAGAVLDGGLRVVHACAERRSYLAEMRGSKYVQSLITGDVLRSVKAALDAGRDVLFSGTPCQVDGLLHYLGGGRPNLFTVDLVCHGVPSPLAWSAYLASLDGPRGPVVAFSFRDKRSGWRRFSIRRDHARGGTVFRNFYRDPYMTAFLRNLDLRHSCYACAYARTARVGDLTLGDFWGVQDAIPGMDQHDKGVSAVLVNTGKGQSLLAAIAGRLDLVESSTGAVVAGNPALRQPSGMPQGRRGFYPTLKLKGFRRTAWRYRLGGSPAERVIYRILRVFHSRAAERSPS
ncbi:MAG: Coenzyme F420 hydrogenase/dehydrogenase, beta subunit C-terminal domain [Spirochaetales bacterium]|nr:Coenzyme F420 hydrogenase/dehydrogenase, beta subunit C-terminal domain [Spirochaetales bacterium]